MASTIEVAAHPHGIQVIALDREAAMNTLSLELIADVRAALDASARDAGVRVVVITGKGRAFCCGAELALACDFRIMADTARFGFPEVSLGAIPGGGGVQKLHRFVGRGKALEMVMLGRRLTAAEAEGCGCVYRSVPTLTKPSSLRHRRLAGPPISRARTEEDP